MDEDRPRLEDRIDRLMASKGYTARREPAEHAGGKWIYRYASVLGGGGSIEIDVNYLYRSPLYGVSRMSSIAIGAFQAKDVPVLDIHEIVAGKVVALVTRRTARDLFDAQRVIGMDRLDWTKIKVATLMIGASAKSFDWRTASVSAIGCEVSDITTKLVMCLPERYFEPFGGLETWIRTVTAECHQALAMLFAFTEGESAFLRGLLDDGDVDAVSLDVPDFVRSAIETCPALRWKAQNVKAWKTGDKSLAPRTRRRAASKGTWDTDDT